MKLQEFFCVLRVAIFVALIFVRYSMNIEGAGRRKNGEFGCVWFFRRFGLEHAVTRT